MKKVICHTAGVSQGNPGPGALGVYITDETGAMLCEEARTIGNTTDTFAEYNAVLAGLQALLSLLGTESQSTAIEIRLESEFVKKQLNAESQINEPGLVPMFIEIHNMRVAHFPQLLLTLISSDQNTSARELVQEALSAK